MSSTSIAFDILARDRASKTFNKVGGSADSMGTKVAAIGKRSAIAFGTATVAAGAFLLKVGGPYVSSLNKIQALTGASDARMKAVAGTLESNADLYAKLGQTTGDAAAGVVELDKAGMKLGASLKAVNATMILAKAGELGVADASSLVANTLNTFGLKARRAGDIANYLANAANISSADVSDLAEAFKYVAPVAASTGVNLKQTNAILAELSNSGIAASNAGTGFRKFLLSLQAPSGAAAKDLKALGVHIFTAGGKMKPLGQVIQGLGSKLNGLADEKRQRILKDIFGLQGVSAAQVILKNGSKGLAEYAKGVGKAGAAQKLAESASKGLMGTLRMFKAEAISAGQSIYRAFSPLVDSALRPLAVGFAGLSKNAGPALQKFVAQGPAKLKRALAGFGGSGMGQQLAKTGSALASFGKSLLPTLRQLGTQLMGTLGPGLKQIGAVVSEQFLPAFRNILPVLAPVAKVLLKVFGSALVGALSGAIKVIKGVLTTVSGILNLIADLVHGRWGKIWGDLGQIVKGALGAVVGLLQVWWNVGILAIFKRGFVMLTKGIWVKGWELLKSGAASGMKSLEGLFVKGVGLLGRALWAGVKGYLKLWQSYFRLVREVVVTGWKVLRSAFGGAIPALRSMLSRFLSGIGAGFRSAWGAAKGAVVGGMKAIAGAVSNGIGRLVLMYVRLPGKILSALGNLGKLLVNAGKAIIQGLIDGVSSKVNDLKSKLGSITKLIPKVKGPLDKDRKLLTPAGVAIMEGLIHGIRSREIPLKKALAKITGYVKTLGDKLSSLRELKAGFLGTFSGSSVFGADLGEGGGIGALMDFQRSQASRATQLAADVQRLVSMGLSKALIAQLQAQGDSGIDQIHALAGGTSQQISALNALDAQTTAALQRAGLIVGNAGRGGNIDSDIARAKRDLELAQAVERVLSKIHLEGTVRVRGEDLVVAIKARNRNRGVKTAGI
jgi:TP901 family phage tail tape measure protein